MEKFQPRKPILAALGICAAVCAIPAVVFADDAQDIQQLKDQVKIMQQKIDGMSTPDVIAVKTAPKSSSLTWFGVTLYGTVDMGVAYLTHGAPVSTQWSPGLPYYIQSFSNHSIAAVAGNGLSQSKVGLSGVEPLWSEDWSGVFRIETGFNPWSGRIVDGPGSLTQNNGKANAVRISAGDSSRAGQAFNGPANAGLSSKTFGTLTFGRQNGLMLDLLTKYDPQQQSQAFSPISLSGMSGGLGATQSNRLDNAAKYTVNVGPGHLWYIHGFGSAGYVPENSNEVVLGADIGPWSIDFLYGLVHGEVAASSLSAAQVTALTTLPAPPAAQQLPAWSISNTLGATISDNTGYSIQTSYNLKPVKLYAGWERIKYNNPSHPILGGTIGLGGYQLGATTPTNPNFDNIVNNAAYGIQRIFQIGWVGARWSATPQLDVTGAFYGYWQSSYHATAGVKDGCDTSAFAQCAGTLDDVSLVADYHWTKRFDGYVGANWSQVADGLANGYLFKNDWTYMTGVRFNF
jgi:predicted porin